MKQRDLLAVFSAVPLACAGLFLGGFACLAFAQPPPLVVSFVPAEKRVVQATEPLVGSVEPYTRSLMASEVAGIVASMPVDEGDRVEAGTVVCQLRDRTARLAHAEAQARLEQLQAQLAELEAGTRPEEIAQAEAAKVEAAALSTKWTNELERITRLHQRAEAASLKEYNDTVAEHAAAKARLAQATAFYDEAVAGPRKEAIARARHAIAAQQQALERLAYDLAQTKIEAPFTGFVAKKFTEVGQWMTVGGDVVELIDLERVLVRVDVPERMISVMKVGELVPVSLDALGKTFRGRIKHVIPQADEKARTFPVEIELANPGNVLKSGMFVRARVPAGPMVESVVVPRDAVLQRGQTHFVVIVVPAPPPGQGSMAMPVPIQLGAEVDSWIAISSVTVQAGTSVVVKGHDRIYGPQPVQPQPAVGINSSTGTPMMSGPLTSQPASAPARSVRGTEP